MTVLQQTATRTFAALPWRKDDAGKLQILLISPRREKVWTIPWAETDGVTAPSDIAQRAAFRRAGLMGTCSPNPLTQEAGGRDLDMEIYPMRTKGTLVAWPERKLWQREWLSPTVAAKRVKDASLADLINTVANDPSLLKQE